jgi:DNA polymerase-3 subunit delta'
MLFTGIPGVGKQATALALAMACNCMEKKSGEKPESRKNRRHAGDRSSNRNSSVEPCGTCRSCRKIQAGNHPDIIQIKPVGPSINIAQVRDLRGTLAMKPYEASMRVAILHDAQSMNPSAGNALLKILEEPPERTVLVLIATQTQDLLPTIVSRCQQIRFNPISRAYLEKLLIEEHGLETMVARAMATMAGGSLGRAVAMYAENWVVRRNWILGELNELSCRPSGHILALAERISAEKGKIPDTLEIIKSWLRDLVMAKTYPDKILNQDIRQDIQLASHDMETNSLLSKIELVQSTQNSIQANPNIRLSLEVMLMKLAKP